jgi:hypothetical protein
MMRDYLVLKKKERKHNESDFDMSYIFCGDTKGLVENVGNMPGITVAGWWPG